MLAHTYMTEIFLLNEPQKLSVKLLGVKHYFLFVRISLHNKNDFKNNAETYLQIFDFLHCVNSN